MLEHYCGASPYATHGERGGSGAEADSGIADVLLGWSDFYEDGRPRDYYVRQLWNGNRGSIDIDNLNASGLSDLSRMVRMVVGARPRPHRRSKRSPITWVAPTKFGQAIASFAVSYAEQNDEDYAAQKAPSNPAASLAEPLSGQPNGLSVGGV